jgi:hypothetical protein
VGLCLVLRARTAVDGDEDDADQRLAAAEAAARRCGDSHVLAAALVQRARTEIAAGRHAEAVRHAEESLRLNEIHGHHEGAVGSLHALGLAQVGEGNLTAATYTLSRALRAAAALHHAGATAESLDCLAVLASREERWFDAAMILAATQDLRDRTGIRRSALTSHLVAEVEAATRHRLSPAALARAEEQGPFADVLQLASGVPMAAVDAATSARWATSGR